MKLRFILKLAIRNLLTRRMRTLITVGGVIIGMAAILFLVSFGYGLENIVLREISASKTFEVLDVNNGGSSILKIEDKFLDEWRQIQSVQKVVPTVSLPVKVKIGQSAIDGVIMGTSKDYNDLAELNALYGHLPVQKGDGLAVSQKTLDLLGQTTDRKLLGLKIDADVTILKILTAEQKDQPVKALTGWEMIGITDEADTVILYASLDDMKDWGVTGSTAAKLKIHPVTAIPAIRKVIENQGFQTDYIGDTVKQINQVFTIMRIVLGSFGLVALIVAALGMFNTLTVSLMERVREVGLMKAIGIKRRDIHRLFLFESLIIALLGGILGAFVGWILGVLGNAILNYLAQHAGTLTTSVTFFYIPYWFFLFSALFAFLVGILTGLYPARRAAQINPLDALRYE